MSRSFALFDNTLVIEDSRLLAIYLRRIVMILASNARKAFEEYYPQFSNIEGLLKEGEDMALSIFATSSKNCVDTLSELDIYSISAEDILENMKSSYYMEELKELEKWYLSVLQNEAEKDAYRTARRKNRSKWVGYGFGIQGAITSAAKAGTLNMLSGAAHGTVNLVGKSFSMMGASMNKSQMFHSKDTRNRLASALYLDIFDWIYSLQKLVQQEGLQIQEITLPDEKRANSFFQNLQNRSLSQLQAYDIAFQIFATNPVEQEYYEYCISSFPEQQKPLLELAEYCGIDTQHLIDGILKKIVASMPHKTEEDTIRLYQALKEKQAELAIPNSEIIDNTECRLEKFDVDARTYRKMIFATREMRNEAERNYEKLSEISKKFDKKSKDECLKAIEAIKAESNIPAIEEYFLSDFENQIKKIEKKDAENRYNMLYKKCAKDIPELSKFKIKKIASFAFAILSLLGGGFFLWATVMALFDFEPSLFLPMIGMIVIFFLLCVCFGKMYDKAENAIKKFSPPELTDAMEKLENANREYENSDERHRKIFKRFFGDENSFTEIDMSGQATNQTTK